MMNILYYAAAALTICAASDDDADRFAAREVLEGFLRRPADYDSTLAMKEVVANVRLLADDDRAKTLLVEAFAARWVDGAADDKGGLTIERFGELVEACPPFGPEGAVLIDGLSGGRAPAFWKDAAFRRWVRGELARGGPEDRIERLTRDLGRDEVECYVFLCEVVPEADVPTLRRRFEERVWPSVEPSRLPEIVARLSTIATLGGLERLRGRIGPEVDGIKSILGNRLHDRELAGWTAAGDALGPLARASKAGPRGFVTRATTRLLNEPVLRGPDSARALRELSLIMDPAEVAPALEPGRDRDWLVWLHSAGVLGPLFRADRSRIIFRDCFQQVRSAAESGALADLFPGAVREYYDRAANDTFRLIIGPGLSSKEAFRRVLDSALDGGFPFQPSHQAALGLHVIGGGQALDRSWEGIDAPSRLEAATRLYIRLRTPSKESRAVLNRHIGSDDGAGDEAALLAAIIAAASSELAPARPATDGVLKPLSWLADHLALCSAARADLSRCRPLVALNERIASDLRRAVDELAGDPSAEALIASFVDRLALALRLRVLTRVAFKRDDWLRPTIHLLRDAMLDPARTNAMRAKWLAALDRPLRECLESASPDDRGTIFRELHLSLAPVRGFLTASRAAGPPGSWPYLAWLTTGTDEERDERFTLFFQTLETVGPIDADVALEEAAIAHLAFVRQGASVWDVEPSELFAGDWNREAGDRVWRRLLDGAAPRPGGGWKLKSIAAKAVESIVATAPAPAPDAAAIRWATNLVTAAEILDHPFQDANGQALVEHERVAPSGRPSAPFSFPPIGSEHARRVDGRLRLRLVDPLARASLTIEPLLATAEAVLLLPNGSDNAAGPATQLDEAARVRSLVYTNLHRAQAGERDPSRRFPIIRALLRLHVAHRDRQPPLAPSFDALLDELGRDEAMEPVLVQLRAEQAELTAALGGVVPTDAAAARERLDRALNPLLPRGWLAADRALRDSRYRERLDALDDDRIQRLLRLRSDVRTVLESPELADLARIERVLDFLDYNISFSRSGFRAEPYFEPRKAGAGDWWPALVLLSWLDGAMTTAIVDHCDRLRQGPGFGGELAERVEAVRDAVGSLERARLATLVRLANHPEAERMLKFQHVCPWTRLDLRMLAEQSGREVASATTLARDGFAAAALLQRIAITGVEPSDDLLEARLFGTAGDEQNASADSIVHEEDGGSLISAVRLAARVVEDERAPTVLREGARAFLEAGVDRALAGAEAPETVLRLAARLIAESSREGSASSRDFFEKIVLDGRTLSDGRPRLSDQFVDALAEPFFARDHDGQARAFERLLARWRAVEVDVTSPFQKALRDDFGRVLAGLARGHGRAVAEGPYLWRPADELRSVAGSLDDRPDDFLRLAAWWSQLIRPGAPAELHDLLGLDAGSSR